MKKIPFAGVLLLTMLLAACDTTGNTVHNEADDAATGDMTIKDDDETNDDDDMVDDTDSSEAASDDADDEVKEPRVVAITTDNWLFTPNAIVVKKGERVTLKVTGLAGAHGFAIPELGVNAKINAGETMSISLPTDTAGTFRFFCNVPCGPGHKEMAGSIVIE